MSIRAVRRITEATPTLEGAGVKLHRGFGFGTTNDFDPFLLFDDFRNEPIEEKRNIVPLFFRGFQFGASDVRKKLTGKLKNLSRYNGLNVA